MTQYISRIVKQKRAAVVFAREQALHIKQIDSVTRLHIVCANEE